MHVGYQGYKQIWGQQTVLRDVEIIIHSHAFADLGHVNNENMFLCRTTGGRKRFISCDVCFFARARVAVQPASPRRVSGQPLQIFQGEREKKVRQRARASLLI